MARRRSTGITSLAINQDKGMFSCCLKTGLRIYNADPLVERSHYSKEELGEVSLCEMVHNSNFLLVVRARKPCSLMLLDDQQRAFKAEVVFKSPIRCVRARKDKVAVVLTSSVQVLALPSLQRVDLIRIPSTERPLCAISSDEGLQMLAAPAHRVGSLQLLDVTYAVKGAQSSSPAVMNCHRTQLACLTITCSGNRVATASVKGTIIRVFDTAAKVKIYEMRRGSDYADVYSLNFFKNSSLLCCVSDKGTMHMWEDKDSYVRLFAVPATPPAPPAPNMREMRSLCAIVNDAAVIVVSEDGTYHKFTYCREPSNCYRSGFEYFLQVGDDDEFLQ